MSEVSNDGPRLTPPTPDSTMGNKPRSLRQRVAARFQLWRIGAAVDLLPPEFDAKNHGETITVKGGKQEHQTSIALTEVLLGEGADVVRTTDITIDREAKGPHRIVALTADQRISDDVGETHGLPASETHFVLNGENNTLPIREVARQAVLASRVVEAAHWQELTAAGKVPIIPTLFP